VNDEIRQFGAANIINACYTSNNGPAFGNTEPFCSLFVRNPGVNPPGGAGPNAIQTVNNNYVNVASQGNRGIDVNLRYEREIGPGEFTFQGEATFMLEDVTQIFLNGVVNDFLGTTFLFRGPEIAARAQLRYELDDWTLAWTANYLGEGSDDAQQAEVARATRYCTQLPCTAAATAPFVRFAQSVDPITYHDFSIRRRFENEGGADVSIVLGLQNIFDERPPAQSTGQFRRGTAALNAYDLVGRRAFFNVSVGW
jgi:iron complex outermembrane receptor protein